MTLVANGFNLHDWFRSYTPFRDDTRSTALFFFRLPRNYSARRL